MSAMLNTKLSRDATFGLERLLVIAGLLVLCVRSFQNLGTSLWQSDNHAHGPIVLVVIIWLIWEGRQALLTVNTRTALVSGFALLILGPLLDDLGRFRTITVSKSVYWRPSSPVSCWQCAAGLHCEPSGLHCISSPS